MLDLRGITSVMETYFFFSLLYEFYLNNHFHIFFKLFIICDM